MPNAKRFYFEHTKSKNVYAVIIRCSDGAYFDAADGEFRASPTTGLLAATEVTGAPGLYLAASSDKQWAEGDYVAMWYERVGETPVVANDTAIEATSFKMVGDSVRL